MIPSPNDEKCETCRYWNSKVTQDALYYDYEHVIPKTGKCMKAKEIWNVSKWEYNEVTEETNRSLLPEYADLKMFSQDGSSYYAQLITMFDFYCYHYDQKD